MVRNTPRDRVWKTVVDEVLGNGLGVTSAYIAEEAEVSEKTARESLKSIPFLVEERIPSRRKRYVLDPEYFDGFENPDRRWRVRIDEIDESAPRESREDSPISAGG